MLLLWSFPHIYAYANPAQRTIYNSEGGTRHMGSWYLGPGHVVLFHVGSDVQVSLVDASRLHPRA
eukprot:1756051-Rhodomonas_salina.1